MTNKEYFIQLYEEELARSIKEHPDKYFWPISELPAVVARMKVAFEKGSFNKDSLAIKSVCKRLNIKHTYTDIGAFFKSTEGK